MLVQYPHLVHDAHVAVVVTEFTLAGTRDTIRILSWLKANAPQSRVIVVANRALSSSVQEISRKDFEGSIERKVDVVIPLDHKSASQAAKLGQPLAKAASSAKITHALNQLMNMTVGAVDGQGEGESESSSASLIGKLGNFGSFKSMVAKKPKAAKAG
jgi:pilus assembly protein CpaE